MHNCCCIVKNRICVGLFAKQPPRVANDVETVTRILSKVNICDVQKETS